MKHSVSLVVIAVVALLAVLLPAGVAGASRRAEPFNPQVAAPLAPFAGAPQVVSYQGQVNVGGTPYAGPTGYFKFAVVDAAGTTSYWSNDGTSSGGGAPTAAVSLAVSSGLFNVLLGDTSLTNMTALPASVFGGTDRYLRVWFSSDNVTFTLLNPDRRIAGVPYALQAEEARNADTVDGQHAGAFWTQGGNSYGALGTLGTNDNNALELKANGGRVLRLEPNATSPNLIGGYSGNTVPAGAYGATIGGGGDSAALNSVTDNYGTVGGGRDNWAGDDAGTTEDHPGATVGGGAGNWAFGSYATVGGGRWDAADGEYATVGGGESNYAEGPHATIGGGFQNTAVGINATVGGGATNHADGTDATVGGGEGNSAGGYLATVPGGANNTAQGDYSFAAGKGAQAIYAGCFVWSDTIGTFACDTTNQFAVRATGGVTFQTGSAAVRVNGNTAWHAGNDGAGSGLDADLLDGQHAGNGSGNVPLSNGTVNTNLNADRLDGQHAADYRVFTTSSYSGNTTTIGAICTNYDSGVITVNAPVNGVIVVEANVQVQISHSYGVRDELELVLATSPSTCSTLWDSVVWTIPASYPSSTGELYTFTVRREFNVSPGANTFYLNGMMWYGGMGDDRFWWARLLATFYPGSTVIVATAPERNRP